MNTPRTDAEINRCPLPDSFAGSFNRMADFARTLETELQQAQAALAARTKDYYDVADAVCRESTGAEDVCRQARETRAALAAVTNERDVFRKAQKICEDCDAPTVAEVAELRERLAAVTLERDEAKRKAKEWQSLAFQQMQNAAKDLKENAHLDQLLGEARAQLAACQSREAKALEVLEEMEAIYRDVRIKGEIDSFSLQPVRELIAALAQPPAAPDSAKDGARLDWLDKMHGASFNMHGAVNVVRFEYEYTCPDLRTAIDAAMAATPPKEAP